LASARLQRGREIQRLVHGLEIYTAVMLYALQRPVRADGTLCFLVSDHLGSSSVTTNASGAKVASALYKAFGESRFSNGSLYTDYKFTGQREESALGIYFFVARWFDPTLGRFMSADTIIPQSQGTQAWDRYAFVNNNPVRYTDPTGHMCREDGKGCDGANNHEQGLNKPPASSGENGACSDPKATNYGAAGSCIYPKPEAKTGSVLSRSNWDVFWQNYCGGGSNVVYNVANCVSNGAQDLNLLVDVVGVIFEVSGTLAGCAVGPEGCVPGAIAGWVAYQPLNAVDGYLGLISFAGTAVADLADGDLQFGESTATALLTAGAGATTPEAFTDLIVDGYGSGYNHGYFNGIFEWTETGEFFND